MSLHVNPQRCRRSEGRLANRTDVRPAPPTAVQLVHVSPSRIEEHLVAALLPARNRLDALVPAQVLIERFLLVERLRTERAEQLELAEFFVLPAVHLVTVQKLRRGEFLLAGIAPEVGRNVFTVLFLRRGFIPFKVSHHVGSEGGQIAELAMANGAFVLRCLVRDHVALQIQLALERHAAAWTDDLVGLLLTVFLVYDAYNWAGESLRAALFAALEWG